MSSKSETSVVPVYRVIFYDNPEAQERFCTTQRGVRFCVIRDSRCDCKHAS